MSDHDEAWMGWRHERVFPFDPRDKAIREGGLKKEDVMSDYDELLARLDRLMGVNPARLPEDTAAAIRELIAERDGFARGILEANQDALHQATLAGNARDELAERDRVIAEIREWYAEAGDADPQWSRLDAILSQVPDPGQNSD